MSYIDIQDIFKMDENKITPQQKYYLKNKEELNKGKMERYNNEDNYNNIIKKSKQKYYLNNKEELNKYRTELRKQKMEEDPEYKEKLRKYNEEYRNKKKLEKIKNNIVE